MIPFNKPHLTGLETKYIEEAVHSGKISGNGEFTQKCQAFFEDRYGFHKTLLTTSCTDALEMCSILLDIKSGDEVIMPAYTFVSTANAFALRGAVIRFADSTPEHPNIDSNEIERLITDKTKAVVIVHYAGSACDMDRITALCKKHDISLIEDAAQAIDGFYGDRPLGSFGDLSTFSFHETKNIIAGEGGLLVINNPELAQRAEIIWEKGTNRAAFFRGEVDKYGWVDIGSSFLPSEVTAAFLYAQLEKLDDIQQRRLDIWSSYHEGLKDLSEKGLFQLPLIPENSTNNAHIFYLILPDLNSRTNLISFLKERDILSVFHYLPLNKSRYMAKSSTPQEELPMAEKFSERLLRLPLFYGLNKEDQSHIIQSIHEYYDL